MIVRLPQLFQPDDLSELEAALGDVIASRDLGEYDGNEISEAETILYMYGPDAEALFRGVERTLKLDSLCRNALVVVRLGGPGAPQREVHIAGA